MNLLIEIDIKLQHQFQLQLNENLHLISNRFCVGDRFYLCDNQILCEYDYEERVMFASLTTSSTPTTPRVALNAAANDSHQVPTFDAGIICHFFVLVAGH